MTGIVRSDGQRFEDVAEVWVLGRHRDGREEGWIINEPDRCEWRWGGIGVATVTVRGEFYRKSKTPDGERIEAAMNRALGAGDD